MDTLESVKRQACLDGLRGVNRPRQVWIGSDAFSRTYAEAWMGGALAATAPITLPSPTLNVGTISARFTP